MKTKWAFWSGRSVDIHGIDDCVAAVFGIPSQSYLKGDDLLTVHANVQSLLIQMQKSTNNLRIL